LNVIPLTGNDMVIALVEFVMSTWSILGRISASPLSKTKAEGQLTVQVMQRKRVSEHYELRRTMTIDEKPPLDPWPLAYEDGMRARDFEDGVADHISPDGTIHYHTEIGRGLEFKPRLGFDQDIDHYDGV